MKLKLCSFLLLLTTATFAQTLTVEKIMKDARWMGTSPSGVFWSPDSKTVYFNWNPENKNSDSLYSFTLGATEPQKANYNEIQKINAINNGVYNASYTQMVYT